MKKHPKNNNLASIGGSTGGLPVVHDVDTGKTEVRIPPTVKPEQTEPLGLAKASPNFRYVAPKALASKEEEDLALKKNVIDENTSVSPENTDDVNAADNS